MASVSYPDSMSRPPTTSVYVRHMDSRNRTNPSGTTPSTYTIGVGVPLLRAQTVQVGDAQLPTDARLAVDYSRRTFGLSEPLRFGAASTLTVTETTTVYNRETGAVVSTTPHAAATVVFPATLNRAASVTGPTIEFAADHGMASVLAYWPTGVTAALVGTRAINYWPVVSADTLNAAAPLPSSDEIQLSVAAELALVAATSGLATLEDAVIGAAANAWLYVPPLTIPEWATVLQSALTTLTAAGTLRQPYQLRLNPDTGLVELQCQGGDRLLSATRRQEVTATVTVATDDVMWRLGFEAGTFALPRFRSNRLDSTGARADPTPFVMAVVPRDVRTVLLERGTYATAAALAAELTTASNSLFVPVSATTDQATLNFTDALGVACTLLLPAGRYTPAQMATFLASGMDDEATLGSGSFAVAPAFLAGELAGAGGFTIRDTLDREFSLDFSDPDAALLAGLLGFETVRLSGASSYTSTRRGFVGTSTAYAWAPDTYRTVEWAVDAERGRLRASAGWPVPSFESDIGAVGADNTFAVTYTELASAGVTPVAHHLALGEVVKITDGGNMVTAVVASSPTGEVGVSAINTGTLDFGAVLVGTGDDIDDAVRGTATPLGRPAFVLHMSRMPGTARASPQDGTGSRLRNATLAEPDKLVGAGESFGPAHDQLGFAPAPASAGASGVVLAPAAFSLEPPPYVLMALLSPTARSERAVFRAVYAADDRVILAKFIVSNGYARVTEESTHVTLTSTSAVAAVQVAWLNPDGTLVDWNGAPHSYSLLFRVQEGHAAGAGAD